MSLLFFLSVLQHKFLLPTLATMKISATATLATAIVLSASSSAAFTVPRSAFGVRQTTAASHVPTTYLYSSPSDDEDEVQRLQTMAAKLRQEAASLEAQQQQERAQAAEKAFQKFDTNGDGQVSLEELKAALEKTFKMDLPEDRVERLMQDFDKNGDGVLQPEEFVGVDQFRNRLEQLASEERKKALDAQRAAQKEAEVSEMLESALETINDRPPTGTDKLVSVLPYLFPLLDGLNYGRFLLDGSDSNPVVIALAVLYTLYRAIPASGFICFIALSALGNNLSINRLVRFNIRQAILLDIALITPGFFGAILAVMGVTPPPVVTALGCDAAFLTMLAVIAYATVSNLVGATPDKVPLISEAVTMQMPPPTEDLEFDFTTGQFTEKKKDDEKKDE